MKDLNVGVRHDAMVKVMFTTPKEEFFYSTFRSAWIKKAKVDKIEANIRKSDSVCVMLTISVSDPKDVRNFWKQVKHDFGEPQQKVMASPVLFDWVWKDEVVNGNIESKSWHTLPDGGVVFKILLIHQ